MKAEHHKALSWGMKARPMSAPQHNLVPATPAQRCDHSRRGGAGPPAQASTSVAMLNLGKTPTNRVQRSLEVAVLKLSQIPEWPGVLCDQSQYLKHVRHRCRDVISSSGTVRISIPAGEARTYSAAQLEAGNTDLEGTLGDGAGKWQLSVKSDSPLTILSLLQSPSGHLTNLSTAPVRTITEGPAQEHENSVN